MCHAARFAVHLCDLALSRLLSRLTYVLHTLVVHTDVAEPRHRCSDGAHS